LWSECTEAPRLRSRPAGQETTRHGRRAVDAGVVRQYLRGVLSEKYVLPNCQASVLCEDIRREITGMQTLVGVINAVPAPQVPIGFMKLCLWTRWCNGIGQFKQTAKLLDPAEKVLGESSVEFQLKDMEVMATNVNLFGGIQFKEYGVYHVEILVDDQLIIRYPVPVVKVNLPGQAAPAPAS
jgi:hypothetical protein